MSSSIKPWSFSRIKAFEQCPRQFYHMKVLKTYSNPETKAMLYGTLFHEAAEFYVRDGTPLPEKFNFAKPALDALINLPGEKLCEYEMGLTEDFKACGFKSEDVWYRGIADLLIVDSEKKEARVLDYKTGRNTQYADRGQLELMALATFEHFPEVDFVRAGLLFVVPKELIKTSYTRKSKPEMWKKWLEKYASMEKALELNVWNPRPSGLCRAHCAVTECPHNGRN